MMTIIWMTSIYPHHHNRRHRRCCSHQCHHITRQLQRYEITHLCRILPWMRMILMKKTGFNYIRAVRSAKWIVMAVKNVTVLICKWARWLWMYVCTPRMIFLSFTPRERFDIWFATVEWSYWSMSTIDRPRWEWLDRWHRSVIRSVNPATWLPRVADTWTME